MKFLIICSHPTHWSEEGSIEHRVNPYEPIGRKTSKAGAGIAQKNIQSNPDHTST